MTELLTSIAVFTMFHALPSTRVRDFAIAKFGRRGFMIVYSLFSTILIVWLYIAFKRADYDDVFWVTGSWMRGISAGIMLIAFIMIVAAITAPRPVLLTGETVLAKPGQIKGILRITRHPLLWSIGIWALIHMFNNADPAGFLFFGYFVLLALLGTIPIDMRRKRLLDEKVWQGIELETSNIPFVAIAQRRNHMRPALYEIGWIRPLLAVVLWLLVFQFHETLFGFAIL